jgi:hypothetical protein
VHNVENDTNFENPKFQNAHTDNTSITTSFGFKMDFSGLAFVQKYKRGLNQF